MQLAGQTMFSQSFTFGRCMHKIADALAQKDWYRQSSKRLGFDNGEEVMAIRDNDSLPAAVYESKDNPETKSPENTVATAPAITVEDSNDLRNERFGSGSNKETSSQFLDAAEADPLTRSY